MAVLASTLTRSSLAEPARLESRAHGTVPLRAAFWRREVVRDRMDGQVPMLDGEPLGSMAEADAPGVEIGDLIFISGKLWRIRVPLADGGGMVRLQLEASQPETLTAGDQRINVHVAGELEDVALGATIAALTLSRLAPGPVEVDREPWTVVAAAAWGDGGLDRVVLRRD